MKYLLKEIIDELIKIPSTFTKKMHSGDWLPFASMALYRISVSPSWKLDPGAAPFVWETVTVPELSVAVGVCHVTEAVWLILSV